ncbi:MAG: DNA repair protein RecN [Nitrospinota bacterium]|nr:DNA repair protein RecN [Nitrospinota bacterium]
MLKKLKIKNIGLISGLEMEFGEGLNILTGETGAGKSMILSALNLLLGERADYSNLKDKNLDGFAEALISAETILSPIPDFVEQGIEPEEGEYIIRRLLQKEGKSRIVVNGNAITLASLKNGAEKMVDIHGQHEHQALLKKDSHLPWLDLYLKLIKESGEVSKLLTQIRELEEKLAEHNERQKNAVERRELLEFKLNEIEKAGLNIDEEGELEKEQKVLANAEELRQAGQRLFDRLYDSETSILSGLEESAKDIEKLGRIDPFFSQYSALFSDMSAQISDSAREILSRTTDVEDDPARLETVEERIALIERLKKKYKSDLPGLLKMLDETREELDSIVTASDVTEKLEKEIASQKLALGRKAEGLHKKRIEGIAGFKKTVEEELAGLNMGSARFAVEVLLPESDGGEGYTLDGKPARMFHHGFGSFQFLISTNEGQEPRPLVKIASGGEVSRIMLALKTAIGKIQPVPVLVFDEIDSGIGGKTADLVGEKLKKLSKSCQIFCITHLSQIARQADHHFVVKKTVKNNDTDVSIVKLSDEERVEELARMQAGKEVTETARQHAREMIGN